MKNAVLFLFSVMGKVRQYFTPVCRLVLFRAQVRRSLHGAMGIGDHLNYFDNYCNTIFLLTIYNK